MTNDPSLHGNTLAAFARTLADAARTVSMRHFGTGLDAQGKPAAGGFDPVTIADRGAEEAMRSLITAHYPDHGIRGEEYGIHQPDAAHKWVLDPIDGTRAYISHLPVWGTLIALIGDGTDPARPVLGVMDQPVLDERFEGDGNTASVTCANTHHPITTRMCADLAQATLSTTDPYLFPASEKEGFEALRSATRLQRYGLDCYGFATLARGGLDLVVETGLQDYDIAALIPIIEGAGGQITSWDGGPAWHGGQVLASGDARIHEQALAILRPFARS